MRPRGGSRKTSGGGEQDARTLPPPGLHVLLIPEKLAVQRVAYRVQILQVQVVNLIAASGGILLSSAEVRPGRP